MKLNFYSFLAVTAALLLAGCVHKTGAIPHYGSKIVNIGHIKLNKAYHGKISITNIGDEDLKLDQIYSDCECTVIKGYSKVVPPRGSASVYFDLKPHMSGYDQQNIFIKNNSSVEPLILIAIRANVEM